MAASGNQMIAQLMEAEKRASNVVAAARKQKIARMKEAKQNGKKQVEDYKAKKEAQLQKYKNTLFDNDESKDSEAIEEQMAEDKKLYTTSRKDCVALLTRAVFNVPTYS